MFNLFTMFMKTSLATKIVIGILALLALINIVPMIFSVSIWAIFTTLGIGWAILKFFLPVLILIAIGYYGLNTYKKRRF